MSEARCTVRRLALVAAGLLLWASPGRAAATTELSDSTGVFGEYLAGRFAAQTQDLGYAADELDKVAEAEPDISVLNNQAFLAALLAGRGFAADLAERLPDNPLATIVLGDRAARDGNWQMAAARFAALPDKDSLMQVLRPLLVAWSDFGGGAADRAEALLSPLAAGSRFPGVFALHAALIEDLAGQTAAAQRDYEAAAQHFGKGNLRFAVILASWQARQGDVAQAQRTIDDLSEAGDIAMVSAGLKAQVAKPAVTNASDGIAEAYLAVAATVQSQNPSLAEALARLSINMRPGLTPARILLAQLLATNDRPQEALTQLESVPQDDPLAPLVALRRAAYLDQAGQPEQAITLLEQMAGAHPDRVEPLAQLGDVLRREKRFTEAAQAYTRAIDRLGTPNRADWPLFYARGICLERSGQWPAAQDDFEYALRLSPNEPGVLNYLAYSWADRGENLDKAKQMLEAALAARPNEGAFIDSLGWVMFRQGDVQGAILHLQRAAELDPEDPEVNLHLGDALAAAGREREAEFQWRKALLFKPDAADEKKLNERLASARQRDGDGGASQATPPAH